MEIGAAQEVLQEGAAEGPLEVQEEVAEVAEVEEHQEAEQDLYLTALDWRNNNKKGK